MTLIYHKRLERSTTFSRKMSMVPQLSRKERRDLKIHRFELLDGHRPISLKITFTKNGSGECSQNDSAHSSKFAPSVLSPKYSGEAFQYRELRQTCPEMPQPFWQIFQEFSPWHFVVKIMLSGNGNLIFGESKFQCNGCKSLFIARPS